MEEHPICPACEATPPQLTRRAFLSSGALALVGVALAPQFLARAAWAAAPTARKRVLVAVFQRGAVDGLNMVVPYAEPEYRRLRKTTAIAPPGGDGGAIDLDGQFGLHPALSAFKPLWDEGVLAAIQATGSPDATRSHFDAQDYMEAGAPGDKSVTDGWLNRAMQGGNGSQTFRAVAISTSLPRSLQGHHPALAIPNLASFGVRGGGTAMAHGFEGMYGQATHDMLGGTGRESFEAVETLRRRIPKGAYVPSNGAVYPNSPFARQLQQVAQLIKADVGLEVAATEIGGWDTHANEGGARGAMANNLRDFSSSLAAFHRDLGDRMADVLIVTMSEFGRKLEENGSGGTDHGHGSCNFIIGGSVRGRKVYGRWPGLSPEALFEGRDLAVTTDFRDVFSEVLVRHLGCADVGAVFPRYRASGLVGFLRA